MLDTKYQKIKRLIGPITSEQLKYVDSFPSDNLGVFTPVSGPCLYSISPMHTHPSYMFVIYFSNDATLIIDNVKIKSEQGKLQALSPNIPHHEVLDEGFNRYIAIFIDKDFFELQLEEYSVKDNLLFNGESYSLSPNLISKIKEFILEIDNDIPGGRIVAHCISIEICHIIIRSILNISHKRDIISTRMEIDKVINFISSNYGDNISIDKLAKVACMSSSHLTRIFKRELQISPMKYLYRVRMNKVKELLRLKEKSITQIALECGFNSSSYLSSCFYKDFKITPTEYQNSWNE
ncbi:transcriptional regulator, AraC family [Gottschalkia acidurici 9a]|uniref:Transcriptional regulator, AraC family n=1 Tax=Gottschalkia acidurici (strain ATCC 7906 / DSM 604 / BCRC 14475 / CIP 104303 / KCTC 5404 / NCIMB 10678 / 9a) TaxID=1128398 RepID=K0B2A6_GOTA9|nr:helix-turn-helix domain-containing protein [Gottschalkia acidurici]AFS79624.1 transcriptional regulator, AraC family [Gottschalkia acidurici 9a]